MPIYVLIKLLLFRPREFFSRLEFERTNLYLPFTILSLPILISAFYLLSESTFSLWGCCFLAIMVIPLKFLTVLLQSLYLYFIGRALDKKVRLGSLFILLAYVRIAEFVQTLIISPFIFSAGYPEHFEWISIGNTSLAQLITIIPNLPRTNPKLYFLLSYIDPFVLWTVVLTILGITVYFNISKTKALITILPWWIFGSAFMFIMLRLQVSHFGLQKLQQL